MSIVAEIRHPTRWYSKLIAALLALSCFSFLASAIVAGYMVYRIVAPEGEETSINLANFPGHPEDVAYSLPDGGERSGWFFPGLTSAPTILLCAGYQTSRGDSLPLAAAIQDHGYNVFLFDFQGGSSGGQYSTLGYREVGELRAAMGAVSLRDDVDRSRFGLWGGDMGGYVALSVAEADRRVRALAVETIYDHPRDLVAVLVDRQGVSSLPLLGSFARRGFSWLHYSEERETPPLSSNLAKLAGVPKLFLVTSAEPGLAASTRELFQLSPEPKEIVELAHGQYAGLIDEEKRSYENRLVSFFLSNLPLEAPASQ
jgi:pimeloyl-ACP methyl ester carboxylesterase